MAIVSKDMVNNVAPVQKTIVLPGKNFTGIVNAKTWNSVTFENGTTVATNINARWTGAEFTDGVDDAGRCCFKLPLNYVNQDIEVEVGWAANTTTGNAYYTIGLTRLNGNNFADSDTYTEWKGIAAKATGGTAFTINKDTYTFNGSNFSAGDPVSVNIGREASNATDTLNVNMILLYVKVRIKINSKGEQV